MRSMKEQIVSVGEKIADGICEFSIKVGEQARGKCICSSMYEPKISIELLKNEE